MPSFLSPVELELFLRLFLAALLGWVIGLERETLGKTAGTRTFALVALGAALFSLSTEGSVQPIAAGIGFLCAGLIIFREGRVEGLTTAAAIWAAAALGLMIGEGQYGISIFGTILILLILHMFRFVHPEKWKEHKDK